MLARKHSTLELIASPVSAAPTLEDYPDFIAATNKLAELQTQHAESRRAETDAAKTLSDAQLNGNVISRLEAEARALVETGGLTVAADIRTLQDDAAATARTTRVIAKAIEIQQTTVEQKRRQVSAAICERMRPELNTVAQRLIAAVVELARADQAMVDFRERLQAGGIVIGSWPVLRVTALGHLRDPNSRARSLVREFERAGVPLPELSEIERARA